ncbi:MAG: sigma-70 family RNA polymerase sigma factor [Chitinophagaceae bacterium]
MKREELIPHLFRTEFRKITSVLCKLFGIEHIEIAEDLAGETFLAAIETWPYKGVPENPTAWLYTVAKNKAKNHLTRNKTFVEKISKQLRSDTKETIELEIDLTEKNISDSQLQMLFALCHPSISVEAQIGLSLRILCGFGIDEIANAFLTNKETINKRLFRAKEKLREEKVAIMFPGEEEINTRLDTVLTTLYLLFNEGYYSESDDSVLREELCLEAMRLTYLLIENESTNLPEVNALLSLFCFHSSRFEARKKDNGEIILYEDQDETLWNKELIAKGMYYLKRSSHGNYIPRFHIDASIAYWHTQKEDSKEKWESILQLYNQLLQMEYSPIAALNRTYALSKANGNDEAINEAEKLKLTGNQYYHSLLGELYKDINKAKAIDHLEKAISLSKSNTDRTILSRRIAQLKHR